MGKRFFILFLFFFLGLTLNLYSTTTQMLNLKKGWNLKGSFIAEIDVKNFDNENVLTVWKWVENSWKVWSPDKNILKLLKDYNLNLLEKVYSYEGFWVSVKNDIQLHLTGEKEDNKEKFIINQGWQLLSLPFNGNLDISIFNNEDILTVWKWSNSWNIYSSNKKMKDLLNKYNIPSFTKISNDEGFWLNSKNYITLNIINNNDNGSLNNNCSKDNLTACVDEISCIANEGYWYNNQCNNKPQDNASECSPQNLSLCIDEQTCIIFGQGYWYQNKCYSSPQGQCAPDNLYACTDEESCVNNDGTWDNNVNRCMPSFEICSSENLMACKDSESCTQNGGYWYNNQCNIVPEQVCDSNNLNYCKDETSCINAGGSWINNQCTANSGGQQDNENWKPIVENYKLEKSGGFNGDKIILELSYNAPIDYTYISVYTTANIYPYSIEAGEVATLVYILYRTGSPTDDYSVNFLYSVKYYDKGKFKIVIDGRSCIIDIEEANNANSVLECVLQ